MNKKILFLDIDGTIVDFNNNIPPSAAAAIDAARKNGHKVYLCTGRSKPERCDDLMQAVPVDGIICSYGAYIESDGKVLFHRTIEPETVTQIINLLYDRGLVFYEETELATYCDGDFLETGSKIFARYEGREYNPADAVKYVDVFFPHMLYGADVYSVSPEKISYSLNSMADYEAVQSAFPQHYHGKWGGTDFLTFADITSGDISKDKGILKVVSHLGMKTEDTIAFGDGDSDVKMFDVCGTGVAMGNASAGAKAAADYVTAPITEDGLYKAFLHLGLIEE